LNINKCEKGFDQETFQLIGILAEEASPELLCLEPLAGEMLEFCRRAVINDNFKAKAGSTIKIPVMHGSVKYVVIHGLGIDKNLLQENIREGSFVILSTSAAKRCSSVLIAMPGAKERINSRSAAEGAVLGCYRFDKYLSQEEDETLISPDNVYIAEANIEGLAEGKILSEAQCYTRDIANEPGNVITPVALAEKAVLLAQELGLDCEIWNEDRIEKERMSAFHAVGRGSANPPRFITLTWSPQGECRGHIALVGKGLTFDSGGLDIKPAEYMTTMKCDKSGACAVLGAVRAVAQLKLPWKVTVIIAAAENMPGGNAYRPDDILRARNGKTIEVNNTDAEGRLTLADALSFASELKPDKIIDIATLTGACAVALGTNTGGMFTNNDTLGEEVLSAAQMAGERFWKLPMDDPTLKIAIKSPVADLVNSGGRYGGAITAAMFLEAFVDKDIPWVHLDIAAADFIKEQRSYYAKGASGFGARTLATLIMMM
jgi:leucyl aminopeptidase